MIENSLTAAYNNLRILEGIKKYQPATEALYHISFGFLEVLPFFEGKGLRFYGPNLEYCSKSKNSTLAFINPDHVTQEHNYIFHTRRHLITKEEGMYIAAHEMAHIGHKLHTGQVFDKLTEDLHEYIADTIAAHITATINPSRLRKNLRVRWQMGRKEIDSAGSIQKFLESENSYCNTLNLLDNFLAKLNTQLYR